MCHNTVPNDLRMMKALIRINCRAGSIVIVVVVVVNPYTGNPSPYVEPRSSGVLRMRDVAWIMDPAPRAEATGPTVP